MSSSFASKRLKSFVYAYRGLCTLVSTQHNMWIHLLATIVVIGGGFYFQVTKLDWMFLIIAIMVVWITEAINTAIEFLCNYVSPELQPLIGKTKDIAAAAVLISAIGASILGLIIFKPYLLP